MNLTRQPSMAGLKPFSMFIFSCTMVFSVGLVFQFVGAFLASIIFNVPLLELLGSSNAVSEGYIPALKFLQIVGALGTFVFSSFLISYFYTRKWFGFFTFHEKPEIRASILILLIMIAVLPFINYMTEFNLKMNIPFERLETSLLQMQEQTEAMMMKMLKAENLGALLINLFMIAIIPAVGEELVFRGLLQKHLTDMMKNAHLAIFIAAAIFSLVHLQVYSFLPRFFLGLILGYLFFYGKSIWYPMIAHLINNAMGVMFYYYQSRGDVSDQIENIGTQQMMPIMALGSLILVVALMYLWIQIVRSNQPLQPRREGRD